MECAVWVEVRKRRKVYCIGVAVTVVTHALLELVVDRIILEANEERAAKVQKTPHTRTAGNE